MSGVSGCSASTYHTFRMQKAIWCNSLPEAGASIPVATTTFVIPRVLDRSLNTAIRSKPLEGRLSQLIFSCALQDRGGAWLAYNFGTGPRCNIAHCSFPVQFAPIACYSIGMIRHFCDT
jgi:hypothetical protein